MNFMLTPRHWFDCPGCDRSIAPGKERGIGFDAEGTLLCADCLTGEPDIDDDDHIIWHDHHVGTHDPKCGVCGLHHRGEC